MILHKFLFIRKSYKFFKNIDPNRLQNKILIVSLSKISTNYESNKNTV